MASCVGKSCSFGILGVFFVNDYRFLPVTFPFFGVYGGLWDLIVLFPDHCLSIYFAPSKQKFSGAYTVTLVSSNMCRCKPFFTCSE